MTDVPRLDPRHDGVRAEPGVTTVVVVAVTERSQQLISELLAGGAVLRLAEARPEPVAQYPAAAAAATVLTVGQLAVNLAGHLVTWRGRQLPVTEQEFALLARLAQPVGQAHTFEDLYRAVWGVEHYADTTVVHSAMRRLRRKLTGAGAAVAIESVRGYGFRLMG